MTRQSLHETTGNGVRTLVFDRPDTFLRVLTPRQEEEEDARTTHVDFPPGDLSFLQGIAPIGTKFHDAADHGVQGGRNRVGRQGLMYEGSVWFFAGDL